MSGHSHYAQIHRQKGINDAKKGNLFSKIARAISIAVKTGGPNIESNLKLREAVDKARSVSMPKENVERAIVKGSGGGEELMEVVYEGFGPSGIAVIVEAATDNKNRTAQEIKNIFEKSGGSLAGPGAVSFNFDSLGFLLIKKSENPEDEMLKLIDAGVADIEEVEDGIEVWVEPTKLSETHKKLVEAGFEIIKTELVMKPKNPMTVTDPATIEKVLKFFDVLDEQDDVQKFFTNFDYV